MKYIILFFLTTQLSFSQLPEGFVYLQNSIPDVEIDLRYFGSNNFVGQPIAGYNRDTLIVSKLAAIALQQVQEALKQQNLCLKIYDAYRPQQAVDHFVKWARVRNDTLMKKQFYPNVKKKRLFKEGYIASRSGHSRGSTVDLTLIHADTGAELDMGSPYDFFGQESWVDFKTITNQQKANRMLLQTVMKKYGFRGYSKEWWHFTLQNEPFKNTYFNFPIE